MRQRYKGIIKDTVESTLNAQFNKDAEIEAIQEEDKVTIENALASTFPAKYEDEKVKLAEKMRNDLTQQMTEAEFLGRGQSLSYFFLSSECCRSPFLTMSEISKVSRHGGSW